MGRPDEIWLKLHRARFSHSDLVASGVMATAISNCSEPFY
jgi:hypothetical protein